MKKKAWSEKEIARNCECQQSNSCGSLQGTWALEDVQLLHWMKCWAGEKLQTVTYIWGLKCVVKPIWNCCRRDFLEDQQFWNSLNPDSPDFSRPVRLQQQGSFVKVHHLLSDTFNSSNNWPRLALVLCWRQGWEDSRTDYHHARAGGTEFRNVHFNHAISLNQKQSWYF